MAELKDNGVAALSRYDVEIAHGGDGDKALWMALYLVGNHIRYFTERVQECDRAPRQATLFDVTEDSLLSNQQATGGESGESASATW